MVRADYCGDGGSHTLDGTPIDVFDVEGKQVSAHAAEMSFEAGWGPDGALCYREPRYRVLAADGELVLPACMSELEACPSWQSALALGAVLGNESKHEIRLACGAPE